MKQFKGKKVVIMGLGLHGGGVGAAKFFCKSGAEVLVTDLKTKEELKDSLKRLKDFNINFILGEHREKDFVKADLVIKNPDVPKNSPFLKKAKENNVSVKTDIEIFFNLFEGDIIGITGTKGKSTVASLLSLFLKKKYPRTLLGGNIGISPLELLLRPKKGNIAVLELSSFELEDLGKSPKTAVITNILKDHLKRHGGFDNYLKAKKEIFLHQRKEDNLVLNYDDKKVKDFSSEAVSKVFYFSKEDSVDGSFLKDNDIYFKEEKVCSLNDLKIKGEHNLLNVLAAVTAAKIYGIDSKDIREVIRSFEGIPFRQQLISEIEGKKYYNDTTATIPEAVIEALNRFSGDIILISGGVDKGSEYKGLAEKIKERVSSLILLPGTGTDKLKEELDRLDFKDVYFVKDMKEAVQKSSPLKGDIVLLSPGGSSFNLFKNEFDRGEKFNQEVKELEK